MLGRLRFTSPYIRALHFIFLNTKISYYNKGNLQLSDDTYICDSQIVNFEQKWVMVKKNFSNYLWAVAKKEEIML